MKKMTMNLILAILFLGICRLCSAEQKNPYYVNLGDFAKGDGSDETEAIQRAIDSLPPANPQKLRDQLPSFPGAVLYIPRPQKFYGISKTIHIVEKWNVTIECESWHLADRSYMKSEQNFYFRWLGDDNGTMFNIDGCMGLTIHGLSIDGRDRECRAIRGEAGKGTSGVTGLHIGPKKARGFSKFFTFDCLRIANVSTGIVLGGIADNGGDIAFHNYNMVRIDFSKCGIVGSSGNLANIHFNNLVLDGTPSALNGVVIHGVEILFTNLNAYRKEGAPRDPKHSLIYLNAGGVQVNKAWSEWAGPFLSTSGQSPLDGDINSGANFFPVILCGVRHFEGSWQAAVVRKKKPDAVPLAIDYNRPTPLHLIDCVFWGSVKQRADGRNALVSIGTVFIDKFRHGYVGDGIEKYHNAILIGTPNPENHRILDPYIVDRRHIPGSKAPASGSWKKGDRVINIDPDPSIPSKAYAGWICYEGGNPGKWAPFGKIEFSADGDEKQ